MNLLKELWGDLMGISMAIFLLWNLIMIKVYQRVLIQEPNSWILNAELVLMGLVILLYIGRLVGDIRGK